MNNIKTVEVTKPIYGLEIGDTATRENNTDTFVFSSERVGNGFTRNNRTEITEDYLLDEYFQVTEWFESKLDYTQKSVREELEDTKHRLALIENRICMKKDDYISSLKEVRSEMETQFVSGERIDHLYEAETVYHNMIDLLEKLVA
jgi:hypothetical protein